MNLRAAYLAIAFLAGPACASAAGDPFVGSWEARVATGTDTYTLRLSCMSQSNCELQRSDTTRAGTPSADTIPFKATRPASSLDPAKDALRYAITHRIETGGNTEFAAIQKLLAGAVDEKTRIDACMSLDGSRSDFFLACTVRGATAKRPVVLFFGSLAGLCGQGFCKYVVYPLLKTQ